MEPAERVEAVIPTGTLPLAVSQTDIEANETLVWSNDGFCWLRGKNGAHRLWQGKFTTLVDAIKDCQMQGFKPTAWLSL